MSIWSYSEAIEPCGEAFGYGDTCPLAKERKWLSHCNMYNTSEGEAGSASHLSDLRKLDRKYDAVYGCLTRCSGKCAQREGIKRMQVTA